MAQSIADEDLHDATIVRTGMAGAIFRDVDLSRATMRGVYLADADIDGVIEGLTVNGVEVAKLLPIRRGKRRYIPTEEFLRRARFADPGLRDDLARLAGDTTDDLDPIR